MHENLDRWRIDHDFTPRGRAAERRLLQVVALTAITMVVELVAGWVYGSMALFADGWHMGSHVVALGISAFACRYAHHRRSDPSFNFGTGKVSSLAGFASGVALAFVALFLVIECVQRLFDPGLIHFDEAIVVAFVGLIVNLASAWLLFRIPGEHGHDHNLRGALIHVFADAVTSILAIAALFGGRLFGWIWLDAAIGIVGAVVIGKWCMGLVRETSHVLLDRVAHSGDADAIREAVETDGDTRVADLHLWTLAPGKRAAIVSVVAHEPETPDAYKARLAHIPSLDHVTVEVNRCCDDEGEEIEQSVSAAGPGALG